MKNGSQKAYHERYSSEHADLIQDIFRHKIVHLAQPKLVIAWSSKTRPLYQQHLDMRRILSV